MRIVVLSDHGGEQLRASGQQLQDASSNHAAWQGYYAQAHDELQSARRSKPLWKRMLSVPTAEEEAARERAGDAWQQTVWAEQGVQQAYGRVQQQGAGVYGEDLLAWSLSGLSDEWVMLRGYRNRRGETDCVLIGPAGVWAIEVKRRRVLLHAVGDQWWFEKTGARGRVYESQWATDGSGRNWPRQVGDIADDLEAWLTRQGYRLRVRTALMLMHERARIVEVTDPAVDFVGTDPRLLIEAIVHHLASFLSPDACGDIVRLVERDHHFHASRRRR